MSLFEKSHLIQEISPPIDALLGATLIDEFISLERRFVLRDWEPAELDGGQFCEILARILYHLDSGNLSLDREFSACLRYIENDNVTHNHNPRKELLHIGRVLRIVYKFRSDRGAVHISSTYTPNHMDARLVLENVRWMFAETLRLFWKSDREEVARAIRQLLQFDTPCVGVFEDKRIVQRVDLTPENEILVLLHHAGETGLTRSEIGKSALIPPSTITSALRRLSSSSRREVILVSDRYRLTDVGAKLVREKLAEKLVVG